MAGTSWSHRLARVLVRPLVGTRVTPNHLTSLRLVTGLLACAALLPGTAEWRSWAGFLWLVSALLDRADGELARIAGLVTPDGHRYDFVVDNLVNSGFFACLGFGLIDSGLGGAAVPLGLWTGGALYLCGDWSERLEQRAGPGSKAWSGRFGFDPDDLLYLLAPILWLGWSVPLLLLAFLGATVMTLLTFRRFRQTSRPAANEASVG